MIETFSPINKLRCEVEASRSDASKRMATEALRRLREEIDAAFEAQRQPINERRAIVTSSKNLTPKWAQMTALLASVGRPAAKKASFGTVGRVPGSLQPSRGIYTHGKLHQLTANERQVLLRRFTEEWRCVAHAAALVTRLFVRARKRREQRLAAMVFEVWRGQVSYQMKLIAATNFVVKKVKFSVVVVVWRTWTSAQRRSVKLREFGLQRRRRLSCEAFCTWVMAATQRARYRRYKQKAARQILRRFWRWWKAGIETQRMINSEVEQFIERRTMNLMEVRFLLWVEYVERQKQWLFAARWSEQRLLGGAYDKWKEVHDDTRRVRHALQLATRRRRRRMLRKVLKVWNAHVHRSLKQKEALAAVLHAQQYRNAFTQLVLNARYNQERERSLKDWKMRRAVRTWLYSSHRDRSVRLRAEFLKENHERLVLHTAVWHPWRRIYLRSVALREFTAKYRAKRLRKSWMAFVVAVNHQEQLRLMIESIADTRKLRALRRVIGAWHAQARSVGQFKEWTDISATFYRRGLLRKAISRWKVAQQVAREEKALDRMAAMHLAHKMVQHWAKWAYWSRRELGRRIAVVKNQRRRRQIQQCVDHWRRVVLARHRTLYSKFFSAWKVGIDVLQRKRHLLELRRLIHLRWRWQRWKLLSVHCQDMRAKAREIQKLREQCLMRYSFVKVWLRKTRRYKLATNALTTLAERHVLYCAFSQWGQHQLHLSAKRLASAFHCKKLQHHYLRLLFVTTIGHTRAAIAYDRRRRLGRAWTSWNQYFTLRQRRREADAYFRQRIQQKAIHYLYATATSSITRRAHRLDAEAWREAVLMQSVFSKWIATAKHAQRCRTLGQRLAWDAVGRRAFRVWQEVWVEKQKLLKAAHFHSSVLLTWSWNALLRVTKRRQLALAMWNHTTTRICLGHVLLNWKDLVDGRRGQYAVAASMYRMQEQRIQQKHFIAWTLLTTVRTMASRREQQESVRWKRACWSHWKLWRVSNRWLRSHQRTLLQTTFCHGLRRHAIQQQACREICLRTTRHLQHRSLAHWRVELWLVRNQTKLTTELKHKALSHWKMYTAAYRQKRQWEYYVQQLHRSQTRSKAVTSHNKRRTGRIFRDTRALQAQLKRYRILMTHVLHAWYFVVQNRHRHNQSRSFTMSSSKKLSRRQLPRSSSKAKQIALELWARRVTQKCFLTWREQSVNQKLPFGGRKYQTVNGSTDGLNRVP